MSKFFTLGAFALVAATTNSNALAEESQSGVSLSGNVALTTDYHWRGVTQSNQDIAIQGGFDLATDAGFYAGVWASSVDFNDSSDTNVEVDFYAGYAGEFEEGFGFDVGVVNYQYPDADNEDLDFTEVYAGISKSAGIADFGATGYYDVDNETFYLDTSAGVSFNQHLSASVGVGKYLDGAGEYTNYNIGGTFTVEGFDLDLRWYDNDTDAADDNIVFTIAKSL